MKKKLCLLMLMLLTGTQAVLHCADVGGDQEEDQLPLVMHLAGDEIRRDELPRVDYYQKYFLSLSVGVALAIGLNYLENTRYGALYLDLLKRFPIIKNYADVIFYGVHIIGLGAPADVYLSHQSEIASERALRALTDLGTLHNQAVVDDGLRYSVRIKDGDRMLRLVDNNNDRNRLIRHAFPGLMPGHEINIDDWMENQEASVSGLFNKLLLGPDNLRRANAVMAKIRPLDDELHKQVAMQQGRNIKFAGKPGKR